MEEENFIRSLLKINNDIGIEYMNSKFPKFIKDYIYKRNKNKLYNVIDSIDESRLPYKLLVDYIKVIYEDYEFGQINLSSSSCIYNIDNTDNGMSAYMRFRILEPKTARPIKVEDSKNIGALEGNVTVEIIENSKINISYIMNNNNGQACIRFSNDNHSISNGVDIINYDDIKNEKYPISIEDKGLYLKNSFITTMILGIKGFLKNKLEMTERINI